MPYRPTGLRLAIGVLLLLPRFEQAGGRVTDLDAVLISHFYVDHSNEVNAAGTTQTAFTLALIRKSYAGPVHFADDLQCFAASGP